MTVARDYLFLNLRRLDPGFYSGSFYLLREFGYTLPAQRARGGSLINLHYEGLMEAGYVNYAKEPYIGMFDDFERFYGFHIDFDFGFLLDLIYANYHHYQSGSEEEFDDL